MIRLGKLFTTPIIIWMNSFSSARTRDARFPVTEGLRTLLRPFLRASFLSRPSPFRTQVPSLEILTDASGVGWSGVIRHHRVQDTWSKKDLSLHINVREMLGILYSLKFFQDALANRTIQIYTDSAVCLFCLRRMGSLHSPPLDEVTREVVVFCAERNISFIPYHIPGWRNVLADQGSRMEPLATEWMLDAGVFDSLCDRLSPFPQVDMFATRVTARLPCYVSVCQYPEAFHVNALAHDFNWNCFTSIYAFPPPFLLPRIIDRVVGFRGSMLLIAPLNLTEVWSSSLLRRSHFWEKLPTKKPLFQFVGREVVFKPAKENPPLYCFFLLPD